MTEMFIILGIIHLLGDFYFQTNRMVTNRKANIKVMLWHVLVYTITFIPAMILADMNLGRKMLLLGAVFISHLLIDKTVDFYLQRIKCKKIYRIVIDQTCHIAALYFLFWGIDTWCEELAIYHNGYLFILIILLAVKPSAILVDKLLLLLDKQDKETEFIMDAGTMIGILERIIIVTLCIFGDMSGIGFIIAAKTMVRYGEFAKEGTEDAKTKLTRTKYLFGTLASTGMALGVYGLWRILHI